MLHQSTVICADLLGVCNDFRQLLGYQQQPRIDTHVSISVARREGDTGTMQMNRIDCKFTGRPLTNSKRMEAIRPRDTIAKHDMQHRHLHVMGMYAMYNRIYKTRD